MCTSFRNSCITSHVWRQLPRTNPKGYCAVLETRSGLCFSLPSIIDNGCLVFLARTLQNLEIVVTLDRVKYASIPYYELLAYTSATCRTWSLNVVVSLCFIRDTRSQYGIFLSRIIIPAERYSRFNNGFVQSVFR